MNNKELIKKVEEYYRNNIPSSRKAENYFIHVEGVRKYGLFLADKYGANNEVIEVAALLHDIGADAGKVHAFKSAEIAEEFLTNLNVDKKLKSSVLSAIENHSMSQEGEKCIDKISLEDKIIRDADGLSFIENSYEGYFQKGLEMYGNVDKAKEETINKISGMTKKITTQEGRKIAERLTNTAIDFVNNKGNKSK